MQRKLTLKNLIREILLREYSKDVIEKCIERWRAETGGNVTREEMIDVIERFKKSAPGIKAKVQAGTLKLHDKFTKPDPRTKKGPLDPLNILNYSWKDLELLFDQYRSKSDKKAAAKTEYNPVTNAKLTNITGVPLVYDEGDIRIWEGSEKNNCIKLNYAFKWKNGKGETQIYSFCIGRLEPGINKYDAYRFGQKLHSPFVSYYFVADSSQDPGVVEDPKSMKGEIFKNWYHFFVIHAFEDGRFGITDATNDAGDSKHEKVLITWEQMGEHMVKYGGESGRKAWDKIKHLKNKLQYVAPNEEEASAAIESDRTLNLAAFQKLSPTLQQIYITRNAGNRDRFKSEMFDYLEDNEDFKRAAINSGYKPTFKQISESPRLIKAYMRKMLKSDLANSKVEMPIPFIQFLSPEEQKKYLDFAIEKDPYKISMEHIAKYADSGVAQEIASDYINTQLNKLGYLEDTVIKLLSPEQLEKWDLYSVVFENKFYEQNADVENLFEPEEIEIRLKPLSAEDLSKMDRKQHNFLMGNIKNPKFKNKIFDEYFISFISIFELNGKLMFFTTKNPVKSIEASKDSEYVICDENGKIYLSGLTLTAGSTLYKNGQPLSSRNFFPLNPSFQVGSNHVYVEEGLWDEIQIKYLKDKNNGGAPKLLKKQDLLKLNENQEYFKNTLKYRAGIIK